VGPILCGARIILRWPCCGIEGEGRREGKWEEVVVVVVEEEGEEREEEEEEEEGGGGEGREEGMDCA